MNKFNFALLTAAALTLVACQSTSDTCDTTQAVSVEQAFAPGTSGDFDKHIKNRVFFGFNKHKIEAEAQPTVDAQATWLKTYSSNRVTLEGNTDTRGTADYNRALGERRAQAVKNSLTKLGVSADRISTISFGKEKAAPGADEATHATNRNVTTVIGG